MKSLESYTPVEMEEVEGEGGVVTSDVDDFTVETSLEDLEFGFSIINSTQKVRGYQFLKVSFCLLNFLSLQYNSIFYCTNDFIQCSSYDISRRCLRGDYS